MSCGYSARTDALKPLPSAPTTSDLGERSLNLLNSFMPPCFPSLEKHSFVFFFFFFKKIEAEMIYNVVLRITGSVVKNLPAVWKRQVRFLGCEDSLEEGMATHSSILAWRIPVQESQYNPSYKSVRSQRVGHNSSDLALMHISKHNKVIFQNLWLWLSLSEPLSFRNIPRISPPPGSLP